MFLLRCGAVASVLVVSACSSVPRSSRSSSDLANASSSDVITKLDLPASSNVALRLDDADRAAAVVVLGMRRIEDACGSYIELRLFPEMFLGGREVTEPRESDESPALRVLLYMPNPKGGCDEPRWQAYETNQLSVGDRVVVAMGTARATTGETPQWKREPRVVALAPIHALPSIVAALPKPRMTDEYEQFLPVPRMPGVGTPASVRLLGDKPRFEVLGEEINDRLQGIVWQRDMAKRTMSFEEAALYCEAQRTAGHDDWRLPTVLEMHGIFSPSLRPPALSDRQLFSAPEGALLWTRTDDDGPWVGNPNEGIVISTHYDDPSPYGNYHVRCVRPGVTRATEMTDRFAQKDGVLHDALSSLSWYLVPKGQGVTREMAERICDQGTFGGFNEWHLPSPEEAFSLMSGCPDALREWEGDADDVWTSMIDMESKVGGTFRICNLYRSVPLAAIFDQEGIDPKNPLARVMCARETRFDAPPDPKPCLMGSELKKDGPFSICEEKGVRHGPFRSSWPNGGTFETANFEHGLRSGMFVMYHEAGEIHSRGDYVKGKLHGDVWAKRPTGVQLFKGAYQNGLPSGRWTFYDTKGREIEYIDMVDGKPAKGQYVRYDDDGKKILECPTFGGWEHGIEKKFDDETGKVIAEYGYVEGWLEGPARVFDSAGGEQSGRHHRGESEGEWIGKDRDGKINYRQSFHEGKPDGVQETLGKDGKLIAGRRFRQGIFVGKWEIRGEKDEIVQKAELDDEGTGTITWFAANGDVTSEQRYLRGKRHGAWIEYHQPNKIRRKEEYRDGYLESVTEYFEDGKLEKKMTYSNGQANGLAETYYSADRMASRGSYVNGRREGIWEMVTPTGHHFEVTYKNGRAIGLESGAH